LSFRPSLNSWLLTRRILSLKPLKDGAYHIDSSWYCRQNYAHCYAGEPKSLVSCHHHDKAVEKKDRAIGLEFNLSRQNVNLLLGDGIVVTENFNELL